MFQRRLDLRMEGEPERPQPAPRQAVDLSQFDGLESPWGEVAQPSASPVHAVPIEVFRGILAGEVTAWEDRPGLDYKEGPPTVVRLGVGRYPDFPVLDVSLVIPLEQAERLPGGRMRYTWRFPVDEG
jgi:hypothetical protein